MKVKKMNERKRVTKKKEDRKRKHEKYIKNQL